MLVASLFSNPDVAGRCSGFKAVARCVDGRGRWSPNGCLLASPNLFSAISKQKGKRPFFLYVSSQRSIPSPNHWAVPQLLYLRLSWPTLPLNPVSACSHHEKPFYAARMSQRPDSLIWWNLSPCSVISRMTQSNSSNFGQHVRVGKEA